MPILLQTTLLLICSNVFMTFAWYAHLKDMSGRPWFIAALVSWGVMRTEYLLQVPANRIGYTTMNLGQLKILQEVIALSVFVPFAVLYMKQPLKLNSLWAALCICGAVSFVFRDAWAAAAPVFRQATVHGWGRVFRVCRLLTSKRDCTPRSPRARACESRISLQTI